jgi:hypothetical protein
MRFSCLVIALAFLAAFASDSRSQSQEPSPSGAEARQQEQAQPAGINKSPSTEQKSSPQQPIIVHVDPAKKTEAEAEEDRRERKEKAYLDRRLVDLTAELSTYTGGLYFATVLLAIATIVLCVATIGLVVMAIIQSRDMKSAIATAAKANRISAEGLHASHRAWVSTECVATSDLVWDKTGCHLTVETTVKNIGIAPAQEVNIQVKIYAMTKSGMEGRIARAMKEPPSTAVGHLLFPNGDVGPNSKLTITREQIDEFMSQSDSNNSLRKDVTINVAVIARYLSTMDRKEARTIRFYDLKMLTDEKAEIAYPVSINIDQDVPQARLSLTHHWMPSYAD